MWVSPWRVYTNEAKTKVLSESDPDAVLLCGEWDSVPIEDARRLGLLDADGKEHSPRSVKARQTAEAKSGGDTPVKESTDG